MRCVVFDNKTASDDESVVMTAGNGDESESVAPFLVRFLQYLETPQYLRRRLFAMHNSLRIVGLLPPLDAPHHVRKHEWSPFHEEIPWSIGNHTTMDLPTTKKLSFLISLFFVLLISFFKKKKLMAEFGRHLLIVFGGLGGLKDSMVEDISLKGESVHDVFSSYLNTCPLQGSRMIRTEEAIFISLRHFQVPIERAAW
ncbi:uncharacterized protein [Elaeis guineensis]|uniref:uncharacterized protein n=1 Tax=Elaeis guineensis var. tenera TaxID=51953 RepID=UPI003C6DB37B